MSHSRSYVTPGSNRLRKNLARFPVVAACFRIFFRVALWATLSVCAVSKNVSCVASVYSLSCLLRKLYPFYEPELRLRGLDAFCLQYGLQSHRALKKKSMDEFATGPVTSVAISPSGRLLAAVAEDSILATVSLPLCSSNDRECRKLAAADRVSVDIDPTASICFSGETIVYTASSKGSFSRYCVEPGKPASKTYTVSDPHGHAGPVTGIACVNPESIIVTCGKDKLIRCWDPETRQCVSRLPGHKYEVRAVAVAQSSAEGFSETVNIVASGGRDKTVRLWDVRASDSNAIHVFSGHSGWVHDVAISGCGPTRPHPVVLSCAGDKTVRMWNLAMMKEELVLTGHEYRVWGVAVASDGSFAVSGSTDATVRAWNLAPDALDDERCHIFDGHRDSVLSVAVTPDGSSCASGCEDGSLFVWNTSCLFGRHQQTSVTEDCLTVLETLRVGEFPDSAVKARQSESHLVEESNNLEILNGVSEASSRVSERMNSVCSQATPSPKVEIEFESSLDHLAAFQDYLTGDSEVVSRLDSDLTFDGSAKAVESGALEQAFRLRELGHRDQDVTSAVFDDISAREAQAEVSEHVPAVEAGSAQTAEEETSRTEDVNATENTPSVASSRAESPKKEQTDQSLPSAMQSTAAVTAGNTLTPAIENWISFEADHASACAEVNADMESASKQDTVSNSRTYRSDDVQLIASSQVSFKTQKTTLKEPFVGAVPGDQDPVVFLDMNQARSSIFAPLNQDQPATRANGELRSIHVRLLDISRRLDLLLQG